MSHSDFILRTKRISDLKAKSISYLQKRLINEEIDWEVRLIVLLGSRGTGKTTLLLQKYKECKDEKALYVNLDDPYLEANRLHAIIEDYYFDGGKTLFIDEVHKYHYWAKDIKFAYDSFPDLKMVVTGSSAVEITKSKDDLSRRAAVYKVKGFSFREYLNIENKLNLAPIQLDDIFKNHEEISFEYGDKANINSQFKAYLKHGYYPYYLESKKAFPIRLISSINQVLDVDLPAIFQIDYSTTRKVKKLLMLLATTAPFKPTISKLSQSLGLSRMSILKLIDMLAQVEIINLLHANNKGYSYLTKPEKILMNNSNISYSLVDLKLNIGTARETFFVNQVSFQHELLAPKYGDFLVNGKYLVEVGGPNKGWTQLQNAPESHLVIDSLVFSENNRIPLWLFGMLY